MIDYWGILGNAATDDTFRNSMYTTFQSSQAKANPDTTNPFACLFADSDYNSARTLVVAKMGPVSLMSLGEWLVVSILHPTSKTTFDNLAGNVQTILGGFKSANQNFYQVLGASIVDSAFRAAFNSRNESQFGFQLSTTDRAALAPVINDGTFGTQSNAFHSLIWNHACKDMVIQDTSVRYAHALEVTFP